MRIKYIWFVATIVLVATVSLIACSEDGGASGDGDADGDSDGDADGDTDGDADGDTDGDADGDTGGDTDGDSDGDADGDCDEFQSWGNGCELETVIANWSFTGFADSNGNHLVDSAEELDIEIYMDDIRCTFKKSLVILSGDDP